MRLALNKHKNDLAIAGRFSRGFPRAQTVEAKANVSPVGTIGPFGTVHRDVVHLAGGPGWMSQKI